MQLFPFLKVRQETLVIKNNYRPIVLVTVYSKIFEIYPLEMLQPYFHTYDY